MMKRKKLGLKLKLGKLKEEPIVIERGKETPLIDELFEVDEGVFVSGYSAAKQKLKLQNNKIDIIFNICSYHCDSPHFQEYDYVNYSLKDLPGEEIKPKIIEISKAIKELNRQGKRILVHCYKGISRAPTCVIAYLVRKYKISVEEALANIQEISPRIDPNAGFLMQLKEIHSVLVEDEDE